MKQRQVTEGTIWIENPIYFDIRSRDVLVKVIRVTDTHVYMIRKTNFGFEDIEPKIVKLEEFYDNYLYLSGVK